MFMKLEHGRNAQEDSLFAILYSSTDCLFRVTLACPHILSRKSASLHDQFVPLLCCIAAEQFSDLPPLTPCDQRAAITSATAVAVGTISTEICPSSSICRLMVGIGSLIHIVMVRDSGTGHVSDFPFLTAPTVLRLPKILVIEHKVMSLLLGPSDTEANCALCLDGLFQRSCLEDEICPAPLLSLSEREREISSDTHGLPLHMDLA